ncbi:hypothetical protein KJ359_007641 [Pestalotiopsis sp. 9143b]|nr:hypothetical protein KJ359_007641 [Pestalotiopsis sp. 9143b]
MLSTFGRGAVQRLPLRTVATSPVVSRLASRAATTQPGLVAVLVSNTSSSGALRSFATKAEATKDTKKPAKKTTTTKASSTKPKKAATKPKPKKKKVVAKKKPVVKKKAVRKELTPEQKERKELQKARLEKQTLKVASLYAEEPKNELPTSGYRAYLAQELKGSHSSFSDNAERFAKVAASWKSLSSSEVQHLNQVAEENKLKNQAKHLAWVESRTPEEIYQANLARHLLKRKYNYPKATKQLLKDERQPARIRTSYIYFTKARWASGEFANKPIQEVAAALSAEWKNMTESEKAVSRPLSNILCMKDLY